VNPELFRGGLPFQASTSYSREYINPQGSPSKTARPPDSIGFGDSWLGKSSYR